MLVMSGMALAGICAAKPITLGNDISYARAGAPKWGVKQQFAANTEESIVASTGGASACLPWGSLVVVKADGGEGLCCWSMTADVTMGNYSSEDAYTVTDSNGPDGPGPCFDIAENERVPSIPLYRNLYEMPGARSGLCSTPEESPTKEMVRRPCRVNGDCASGTCDTSATEAQRVESGCALLRCMMDTASAYLSVRVER